MTIIEDGVPMPDDDLPGETYQLVQQPAAKKPRKSRARTVAAKVPVAPRPGDGLLAALRFVAVAQKKNGDLPLIHSVSTGGWLAASNGTLTVACQVEEDLATCPHTFQLADALSKCGDTLQITQLSTEVLSVRSGEFQALIPCLPKGSITIYPPDPPCATIDDKVKAALGAVMFAAVEGSPNAKFASVLLQSQTCVATNGHLLLESWHGWHLPDNLMLPKCAAVAVVKCPKKLTQFGFSNTSVTFYFEDGSFIKTQLFCELYPHYKPLFDVDCSEQFAVPDGFFAAVKMLEPYAGERGGLKFENGHLIVGDINKTKAQRDGASLAFMGLPNGYEFDIKYVKSIEHVCNSFYFHQGEKGPQMFFFGQDTRGLLMGFGSTEGVREAQQHMPAGDDEPFDSFADDIPY